MIPALEELGDLIARLGPVGPTLAAAAALTLFLTVERAVVFAAAGRTPRRAVRRALARASQATPAQLPDALAGAPRLVRQGADVLLHARPADKTGREEAASLWLEGVRGGLTRGLGLLQLVAALAPMLGLLGTVLGMVVAFQAIADQEGPVHPALLADGLWQAMLTTVVGLAVALPATAARWAFDALAEARVGLLAGALSELSLRIEAERDAPGGSARPKPHAEPNAAPARERAA
ncbi:MAG: MotA/TolQ/ExbB proton channel family protein [Marivibrio sp.]|uniref:MotA/TolQ/ExbB proton channel family protein n=1 Tax=Marivibrio sp. TaxID=2039719 RepID=UPI0032EB06AF